MFLQQLDGGIAGNAPAVFCDLLDFQFFLRIVLIIDIADDFLQQVLHGDQSGSLAIFINHNGNVQFIFLHILEKVVGVDGVRHEICGAQQVSQRQRLLLALVEQVFPRVEDAEDVVNIAPIYRETG